MTDQALARLESVLSGHPHLAIAVSGGVDSMTLAHVANGVTDSLVIHATSPAVPEEASARVAEHARRFGWQLLTTDSGEFADPRYRSNPTDRCYFCKNNLYVRIATLTDRTIASGANLDDLDDYRPGLIAARDHAVVHPFIEAGIAKADLRRIAARLGLSDIAELPAQPCLASRVETGIAIDAADLAFIHAVETAIRQEAPTLADVRCRVLQAGIMLEIGAEDAEELAALGELARRLTEASGRVFAGTRAYRRGSAFIHSQP